MVGGLAVIVLLLTGESEPGSSAIAALPQSERARIAEIVEPLRDIRIATPLPQKQDLAVMVERPLFAATRRPIAIEQPDDQNVVWEVEPAAPAVVIAEPEMAFVGSLVRDDTVLALVTRGYYGDVESIGVGEEIDGWRVLDIGDRTISLGLDDRRLEYRIFD